MGVTAGITEMLMQSHEGVIDLLPALPDAWADGSIKGLCARGGFELAMTWKDGKIISGEVVSRYGNTCRIKAPEPLEVSRDGKKIRVRKYSDGSVEIQTKQEEKYTIL